MLRVRKRFVHETLEAALKARRPSIYKPRKVDGRLEAHIIALASSDPPEGRAQWSLRLLADVLVELAHVSSISPETVRQVLKKTNSNRT
ncbi:helix-turn-helix domain-containing protein [Deinococcus apachensis]|uniref:helix-turn-helix domain-containing protein n=1 Tax=Deinococcus apachensis TaxID=309886 RepID=UPI00146CFEC7